MKGRKRAEEQRSRRKRLRRVEQKKDEAVKEGPLLVEWRRVAKEVANAGDGSYF